MSILNVGLLESQLWDEIVIRIGLAGREVSRDNLRRQAESLLENMYAQRKEDGPGVETVIWCMRMVCLKNIISGLEGTNDRTE